MDKKYVKCSLTVLVILFSLLTAMALRQHNTVEAATLAKVYVNPPQIVNLTIGNMFTVNVTVANVTDLAGWAIKLYYNPKVVNASAYQEGPFLQSVRTTFFLVDKWTDNYNATHGLASFACFLLVSGAGANGNGTLLTLTFKITGLGYSLLDLDETELKDSTTPIPQSIPHTAEDGSVDTRIHNIAVTAVTPSKNTVARNDSVQIYVTVQNAGNFTENFNLTAYCNTTAFATQTVTLADGETANKTFTWNTTGFDLGNYTIKAVAEPVPGETQIADNTKEGGIISVILPKIKIINVVAGKTIICQGYTAKINVTTLNEGGSSHTFSLATYYSGNEIETKAVTQGNLTQVTTFVWNTTGVAKYINYTISASTGESSLANGTVAVVYPGDVKVDKKVDMKDIAAIARSFGTKTEDPLYDPNYDINDDGKIDMKDIAIAAKNFGYTEP